MHVSGSNTIPKPVSSFKVQLIEQPLHDSKTHIHPGYEINLLLQGQATLRMAGIPKQLSVGDLFVIGPEVPYAIQDEGPVGPGGILLLRISFLPEAFGPQFFELPELSKIQTFLMESPKGIYMPGVGTPKLIRNVLKMREAESSRRLILLIHLLEKLAACQAYELISPAVFSALSTGTSSTFSTILQYIYSNFDKPISLEEMASLANLNKYSFCRYFKSMTQMSFVSYLNEFRISKACKFLYADTYNISQIGYLVGFNTLSNFYRQFQKIMHCTPSEYREECGNSVSLET